MALRRIVFEGGSWDGRQTQVDASGTRAERWDQQGGLILVYELTDRLSEVEVEHDTRQGKRYSREQAHVYALVESKPDLATRIARGEWTPSKREKGESGAKGKAKDAKGSPAVKKKAVTKKATAAKSATKKPAQAALFEG